MRILVCGGRNFNNFELLNGVLNDLFDEYGFDTLIHGAARGADKLAGRWAELHNELYSFTGEIEIIACPANWNKLGRRAGYVRNVEMLTKHKPDLVVAFPGGRGTAHMVKIAKEVGVQVIEVEEPNEGVNYAD